MRLGKPSREFRIITNVVLTKLIMDILPWVLIGLINIFGLFQFHFNCLGSRLASLEMSEIKIVSASKIHIGRD